MSLAESYRCARSLEAVENYARADFRPPDGAVADEDALREAEGPVSNDQYFWSRVLAEPQAAWGRSFELYGVAVSTWVARVPGLFWSEGARALRKIKADAIEEYKSDDWLVLRPHGKSKQVLGGIGTLRFPQDENGFRLVTLSGGHNASSGIPALVSPAVWEHHRLEEGSIVWLRATWHPLPERWAERFPSVRGIPKGHLVVSRPEQVSQAKNVKAPTQFHPCTVMEYYEGDAKLYDFVFATVDTQVRNYRQRVEDFFDEYKTARGRFGKYLINADVADPLWDAEYETPEALRRAEPGAKSQLELLQARVRGDSFRGQRLDLILQFMSRRYNNDGLERISEIIGVPVSHWFNGAAGADSSAQLLQLCVERGKVEELLDAMAAEHPGTFL